MQLLNHQHQNYHKIALVSGIVFEEAEERSKLIKILASLNTFQGEQNLTRSFLREANLHDFASGIDLPNSPEARARQVVDSLEPYGYFIKEPDFHALGKLLGHVLKHVTTLPTEDAKYLAQLVLEHGLIKEKDYQKELAHQYNLTTSKVIDEEPQFKIEAIDVGSLESIINSENNFLSVFSLLEAFYVGQTVGRIERQGEVQGTGFLITPDTLLTCQHVLKTQDFATETEVRFGHFELEDGEIAQGEKFRILPDFYESSPKNELDYALVRLEKPPLDERNYSQTWQNIFESLKVSKKRRYLQLRPQNIFQGDRANILQYPSGQPLKAVLTQNYIVSDMQGKSIPNMFADTSKGSSGSPILNGKWEVIGLHRSGNPKKEDWEIREDLQSLKKQGYEKVNEGISMQSILSDIKSRKSTKFIFEFQNQGNQ